MAISFPKTLRQKLPSCRGGGRGVIYDLNKLHMEFFWKYIHTTYQQIAHGLALTFLVGSVVVSSGAATFHY